MMMMMIQDSLHRDSEGDWNSGRKQKAVLSLMMMDVCMYVSIKEIVHFNNWSG